jgi:bifunctional non-homologous end joining protein LigD
MRLTRVAKPFDDPDYIFELKHDGFRAIAYIEAGECQLVSRNLNHFKSFGSLKESLGKIPVQNAILDGEVVCLDHNGVSQFNELMSRKGKPVFYAFDQRQTAQILTIEPEQIGRHDPVEGLVSK